MLRRMAAIGFVFVCASIAWMILGATIHSRTYQSDSALRGKVASSWGVPHKQRAPSATYSTPAIDTTAELSDKSKLPKQPGQAVAIQNSVMPVRSRVDVDLALQHRRKGLLWYSTYGAAFRGEYLFRNSDPAEREFRFHFPLPAEAGVYDDLRVSIDGRALPLAMTGSGVTASAAVPAGGEAALTVSYRSQGLDRWQYTFGDAIAGVEDFGLRMKTNFSGIDFPEDTLSPVSKSRSGEGWTLEWKYGRLVSGVNIAMTMPAKLQPGQLAGAISYFAPVSLFFFFFLMLMITTMRGIDLHPMNYFFLAASFFAFHLLLAYLVDHISIHTAFAVCSVVSIALVVSYLRIAVGPAFALREAALAQFVYLVLFSYAFFFEGLTGLVVTIGCIVTLFIVMQLTAHIRWSDHFGPPAAENANR
jgi:inner membrane protein involved in colicin E2 resistance